MSAYNRVNGEFCGHNRHLLREILKDEWGFKGFVMSDFVYGIRSARLAAFGGLDIEMPFRMHYRSNLAKLVRRGEVPVSVVDEAVKRILSTKLRFSAAGEPQRYGPQAVACPEHRALARQSAVKSMVLLQNRPLPGGEPLLPLQPGRIPRLLVLGELANQPNIGDHGSSRVRPPEVITFLDGLRRVWKGSDLVYLVGKDIPAAVEAARHAQAVVMVAGYNYKDEGESIGKEGGDRSSLSLHSGEEALIKAVVAVNPAMVVVLVTGSAVITEAWRHQVAAIVVAWYPGMQGGQALTDLLLGAANFSGKLPCTFPKRADQLPFFDSAALEIEYGSDCGYIFLERHNQEPAFPFGFGLSYTRYGYEALILEANQVTPGGVLRVSVQVTNTGGRAGEEIIQMYTGAIHPPIEQPLKQLKGFNKIQLEPGETRQVSFELLVSELAYYDEQRHHWEIAPGGYKAFVGPSSQSSDCLQAEFQVVDE